MVSFRLSPEEYRQLCDACLACGVRSVSELARNAMQNLIFSHDISRPATEQIQELRERVTQLATELDRLSDRLRSPLNPEGHLGER